MARRKGESQSESVSISDIFIALRRADRALTHLYDLVLAPTGLKATQVAILRAIQQSDEIAQWRLAADFGISDASLSRRLSTLRTAGLVAMRISASHRKERLYQLTARGARKCEEVQPYWNRAQGRLTKSIGNEHWELFLHVLCDLGDEARTAESTRCVNSVPVRLPVLAGGNAALLSFGLNFRH